jgi:hypothetical protein
MLILIHVFILLGPVRGLLLTTEEENSQCLHPVFGEKEIVS